LLVGTGPGQGIGPERQADGLSLLVEQLVPDGVHGHAIELFIQGGDESYDFNAGILPEEMQGPGAVFAAGPRNSNTHTDARPRRLAVRWWRPCG
jgi:hypothetical protein